MMKPLKSIKRQLGISVYPSPTFLAQVDALAVADKRKRSPMLLILAEEGAAARKVRKAKS